jgi:hypothetical protein
MFEYLWRDLVDWCTSGKKKRQQGSVRRTPRAGWARPRLELLEDRCLLSSNLAISHLSNNDWTQGLTNFNGGMTISGGTAPYSIVSDANLPNGATPVINGNQIDFTGTPTLAKTFSNCTITIKDNTGATASKTFVLVIEPNVNIGNLPETDWTVNRGSFDGAMTIGGGTGTYHLVSSAGLPTGLTAAVSGDTIHFTGTPTGVGTFAGGSVTVADSDGATATQTFAITINPAPTLSDPSVLQWDTGTTGYNGTVTITGGTGPYTITAYGDYPFNPTVGGNTIYFSGSAPPRVYPDAMITITDAAGATATETDPITLNQQATFSALSVNQWTVGSPGFNGNITITDGTEPFTIYDSHSLPPGLTPVVNGDIISFTGTPTAASSFSGGIIKLEDSGGGIYTVAVNINIHPPLTFTTTAVPIATSGTSYSANLQTTGGTGTVSFALTGGSLPAGLTLQSNGHIGGTSSASGTFSFTATATDSTGEHQSDTFNIAISPAISIGNPTQTVWTGSRAGLSSTLAIKGGAGTFTLTSAVGLPSGVTASLSGNTIKITGMPGQLGTFNATVTVRDSAGISASESFTLTINPLPTLSTLATPVWTGGINGYPATITISGGTGPYTIVSSKGLPFSPVIAGNTILLTGNASAGNYSKGSITIRDLAGATVTENVGTIIINPAPTISHMSNNNWTEGAAGFNGVMTITGGTGPFTVLTSKNVPLGLTPIIVNNTIAFTGTPEVAETVSDCSVTIEDAAGYTLSRTFLLDIAPPVVITTNFLPPWRAGVDYTTTLQAKGGTGNKTFTLTGGALPPGLKLESNGTITGLAKALGSYTFTITVTDSTGATSSDTYTL